MVDDTAVLHQQAPTDSAQAGPSDNKVAFIADDGHIRSLRRIEADVICLAVEKYRGQLAEAARRLGIGRSTLYRKLEEVGALPDRTGTDAPG
jgi:DNA-binding NtrC family response regulator